MTAQNAYVEMQTPPPPISFIFSSVVINTKFIYHSCEFECPLEYMLLYLWKNICILFSPDGIYGF